ncbi:hypothetical protein VNO78_18437 [Psophocarpus tetragonolobus]|uniref:Uncharacterized protein n=1 Tax=Psophocarpus tetragonolobus TaxID=3891 RepID=A0AAN9SKX4_PSOTE
MPFPGTADMPKPPSSTHPTPCTPSSPHIYDACTRFFSWSYSPRLQVCTLKLSVDISLDYLSTIKSSSSVTAFDSDSCSDEG